MCCLSVRVHLNQSTCLSPPFDPSYLTLHFALTITATNHAGAWAGKLVELLKKETQRPAALATLPVVPRKRCIFNVHCPRPQQQIPEPVPCPARVAHTASRSGTGTAGGREGDRRWEEKEKEKDGNEDRNGEDRGRDQSHSSSSSSPYPSPHRDSPLVVGPKGVYFRPEGAGGKFITGISPSENQVKSPHSLLLSSFLFFSFSSLLFFCPLFSFLILSSLLFISLLFSSFLFSLFFFSLLFFSSIVFSSLLFSCFFRSS